MVPWTNISPGLELVNTDPRPLENQSKTPAKVKVPTLAVYNQETKKKIGDFLRGTQIQCPVTLELKEIKTNLGLL